MFTILACEVAFLKESVELKAIDFAKSLAFVIAGKSIGAGDCLIEVLIVAPLCNLGYSITYIKVSIYLSIAKAVVPADREFPTTCTECT